MRLAAAGALLFAVVTAQQARASDDPSDVPTPAPAETPPAETPPAETPPAETLAAETLPAETLPAETLPAETPPAETLPAEAPPAEAPPAEQASVDDPLVACRALILDDRWDDAERCLHDVQATADASPSVVARARALADVVGAWRHHLASVAPIATPPHDDSAEVAAEAPREQLSLAELVHDGTGRAVVHGALAGGGAGFLISAAIASGTRASEQDTIGWLIAAPAVGGLAGAAGGYTLARALRPSIGDARLATSTMWMGATQGFLLQLAVFDQSPNVGAVPLRFVTVLGGGVIGLGAGAALAPLVDVEDGDVAVAHSAALWGGVLTSIVLAGTSGSLGGVGLPVLVAIVAGGIGLPYATVLAAHPLLEIERWPSFLIDGGGAAGLLISGAFVAVTSSAIGSSPAAIAAILTVGTAAGLTVGTIGAQLLSSAVRAEAQVLATADDEGEE